MTPRSRPIPRPLAPAAPRQLLSAPHPPHLTQSGTTSFYQLPPEIRVQIYSLVFAEIRIEITPIPSEQPQETQATQQPTQPRKTVHLGRMLPLPNMALHNSRHTHPHMHPRLPAGFAPVNAASNSWTTESPEVTSKKPRPHPLLLTTHLIRREALPIAHAICPINAPITDYDFTPLLTFLQRIPPESQRYLLRNTNLTITLKNTKLDSLGPLDSQRRWLALRADKHRFQATWVYKGARPGPKIVNDLRRRWKRMKEADKKAEFSKLLEGMGIEVPE